MPRALAVRLALIGGLLAARFHPAAAQPTAIHYVYDDLSRLIAVVDQEGNAAIYTWDAAGNLLAIERIDSAELPGRVGITLVSPNQGRVGSPVQIFGKGFSTDLVQNQVTFTGAPSTVTAAAPNRLLTAVPAGAVTGPITVTTPLGTARSPRAFRVLGTLAVTPKTAALLVGAAQQFRAEEAGLPTADVRWSVNGIAGGDPGLGTITGDGLYRAPAAVPAPATVTVTATHRDDARLSASAGVTILPPLPAFLTAPAVSLRLAPGAPATSATAALSVAVAEAHPGFALAPAVGLSLEPVVTGVSPDGGPPGAVRLLLTLAGAGLADLTGVAFLVGTTPDPAITVERVTADAAGIEATVEISIAANALPGPRVVQVITPGGVSTAMSTGSNVFSVR